MAERRYRSAMYPLSLETERLVLRDYEDGDHVAVHVFESDPEVLRYQTRGISPLEETRAFIDKVRAESLATPRRLFELAVVSREDQTLIGRAGIVVRRPEHAEAELFYAFRRDRWGRGYAAEAAQAMVDFGFGRLELHRIYADTDPRNVASMRVAEKVGMQREGLLREKWFIKDEWCSSVMFAILDREWAARRT
ncbi:GNAT family N-acetyltransferase [Pendulispora albinea]|uniref:GNAT family N-acetyltransferase n=1 Tax=Pendulispora albinea TaxID=2741071 RepID=A0ABZ2LQW5_9BACT